MDRQSSRQPPNLRVTGSSSANRDWLTSKRMAAAVNCLLTEAIWNRVDGVHGRPRSWSAIPLTRGLDGEPEPGQRRDDDVERVRGVARHTVYGHFPRAWTWSGHSRSGP